MICLDDLVVGYKDGYRLKPISIKISKPGIYAVVGPSGIGKTTFLQCLAGIKPVVSGRLSIMDIDINDLSFMRKMKLWKENLSFHFQINNVMPNESIMYNIALSRKVSYSDRQYISSQLSALGLEVCLTDKTANLSVGQKNRVSIIRCFYRNKTVVLLDEPLVALDKKSRASVMELLCEHKSTKYMIVSTHDDELIDVCDQLIDLRDYI